MESFGKKHKEEDSMKRASRFKIQELERSTNPFGNTQNNSPNKNYINCPSNPNHVYNCKICENLGRKCPYRSNNRTINLCNHTHQHNYNRDNIKFASHDYHHT